MSLTTNFNVDPYYDDYNEDKKFTRVLFKPGVAVQARELTQLQTMLQTQISRFGDNIYKEGTIIDGCAIKFDPNFSYVKILDVDTAGAPVAPSTPLARSRVIDEINVSGPKGGLPEVGLSGGGGNYGAYRTPTRSHAGIDIGTSGQKGWLVGFRASGTVTYAAVAGGYGNLVIIKSGNTEYYFAHLARIMVRPGPYNGQVIGEIGNTGSGSGIHLHYEVRPNGKPIDPKPYLNLLDIGRKTAPTSTAISAAKPSTSKSTSTSKSGRIS